MFGRVFSLLTATLLLSLGPCVAAGLDAVKDAGALSFAMSGQYPPFNFVDESNQLTGFDVAVCSDVARRLGVAPKPLSTAWDGIIPGLLAGKYDLICGSMAITPQRQAAIDFTAPYYRSGAQLFVRRGSAVATVADLAGKKVGVTLGTTYETWVRDNIPGAEVRTYKGVPAMILEVANGRLDGFITDRIVGAMAIDDKGAPLRLAGPLLYEERMGIALTKGQPELLAAINRALEAMRQDGSYHDISMKWLKIDAR